MKVRLSIATSVACGYLLLVGLCMCIDPPTGDHLLAGLWSILLTLPWSLILKESVGITTANDPRWIPICMLGAFFNAVVIFACALGLGTLITRMRRRMNR